VDEYIPRGVIPAYSLQEFGIELAAVAEAWRYGTVIRSWLLNLIAGFLQEDQQLGGIVPCVADSGGGRWTAREAINFWGRLLR
jgi:6-phosphogluconate dehydrogenase